MNKESSPGKNSKFNRYDSDKSSIESDSEEEIEVEEEVTATESESEEKETNEKGQRMVKFAPIFLFQIVSQNTYAEQESNEIAKKFTKVLS